MTTCVSCGPPAADALSPGAARARARAPHPLSHMRAGSTAGTTEWPRIREVESERFLMDMHGMFYELPPFAWGGAVWGIRPVAQHLRMVPDFASYRGFLVLGGNQVSSIFDNNWVTGQSQSGLWLGKTDDLYNFGKPQGWGAVWRYTPVTFPAGQATTVTSDPYLMTGFDKKVLHLRCDTGGTCAESCGTVSVQVLLDFTGSAGHVGATGMIEPYSTYYDSTATNFDWCKSPYTSVPLEVSAHWARVSATASPPTGSPASVNLTAWFTYT